LFIRAEAERAHQRASAEGTDWKNAFSRSQANIERINEEKAKIQSELEKKSKMLEDADKQIVRDLKFFRGMERAVVPIVDMLVPKGATAGADEDLLARAEKAARGMDDYIRQMARDTVGQVLASVQSFNPDLDLAPVANGMPEELSEEAFQELATKLGPVADAYMKNIDAE
jgi:hypothetical protein